MSQPSSRRLPALDAVRGLALLGILVVNLSALTQPLAASGLADPTDGWDLLAWVPMKWVFETKFLVVFSLLFGMGAALQREGAARKGLAFGPRWRRRMMVLAGIGVAHALLLWSGDILLHYALVGLVLPPLLRLRGRALAGLVVALIALPWLVGLVGHLVLTGVADAGPPSLDLQVGIPWVDGMIGAGLDPRSPAFQEAEHWVWTEGGLEDQLLLQLGTWAGFQTVLLVSLQPLRTLGVFLIGAALWRADLFRTGGEALRRYLVRRVLPIGVLGEGVVVLLHLIAGLDPAHPLAVVAEALHGLSGLAMGVGLVGALARTGMSPAVGRLLTPLARVGRMALTSYLGQSLAGVALVGLVGFGVLHRAWHLPVALGVVAAQAVVAVWWLERFRMGPVEWVWRSLTLGEAPRWNL